MFVTISILHPFTAVIEGSLRGILICTCAADVNPDIVEVEHPYGRLRLPREDFDEHVRDGNIIYCG